jgi:hypothetical protein
MDRQSDNTPLVLLGGVLALFLFLHTIFNILFEEWIKHQLENYLGYTAAEMIERFGAIALPAFAAVCIVWLLFQYLKRVFRRELNKAAQLMTLRQLEILFDPQSPDFVRTEYRKASLQKITRYSVAVYNPSATSSAQDVFLSADDSLIVENTIQDAWGALMRSTARIDPRGRWFVELFGLPEPFGSSDPRNVFQRPQHFTLRASALDTPVASCEFEFDASKFPVIRKIG